MPMPSLGAFFFLRALDFECEVFEIFSCSLNSLLWSVIRLECMTSEFPPKQPSGRV